MQSDRTSSCGSAARRAASGKRDRALAVTLATLMSVAVNESAGIGHAPVGEKDGAEIVALKREYLACDHAASRGRLGTMDIRRCSIVYETLKARAFDGDFDKLLAWSRRQSAPPGAPD